MTYTAGRATIPDDYRDRIDALANSNPWGEDYAIEAWQLLCSLSLVFGVNDSLGRIAAKKDGPKQRTIKPSPVSGFASDDDIAAAILKVKERGGEAQGRCKPYELWQLFKDAINGGDVDAFLSELYPSPEEPKEQVELVDVLHAIYRMACTGIVVKGVPDAERMLNALKDKATLTINGKPIGGE